MKKTLLTALVGVSILCAGSHSVVYADEVEAGRFVLAEATPLSLGEMENLRGGFMDPSGMLYNFSVNVQTALNGAEVFSRSINVAPTGTNGQLQATTTAGLVAQNIPGNVSINMIGNGNGVVVTDITGTTTVINQTAGGVPSSIILNTANNRNVSQSVNVSLALQNMSSIMNILHSTAQGSALSQHMALRSLGF